MHFKQRNFRMLSSLNGTQKGFMVSTINPSLGEAATRYEISNGGREGEEE